MAQARQNSAKYFAFICYTHKDYKEAKFLYKRLQNYALPNRLMKGSDRPKRLVPMFIDHISLPGGEYTKNDKQALRESRYLIVVCSKNLHDHDKYVNAEIDDFLNCGHSYDDIIPIIIDKDEQPEVNCYPSRLIELHQNGLLNLIGTSIFDPAGKRDYRTAIIKTIAQIHNLSATDIINEDHKRRRRNVCISTGIVITMTVLIIYTYICLITKRFPNTLNLVERYYGTKEWTEVLSGAQVGDTVQFQIEFINELGILGKTFEKIAKNNDLSTSTDNVMIRAVLPDNLEYIQDSTIIYNSNHQEGIKAVENTVTTTGINIGDYSINSNGYVRFNCRIIDKSLKMGENQLVTWASCTIKEKVQKDDVSIFLSKE